MHVDFFSDLEYYLRLLRGRKVVRWEMWNWTGEIAKSMPSLNGHGLWITESNLINALASIRVDPVTGEAYTYQCAFGPREGLPLGEVLEVFRRSGEDLQAVVQHYRRDWVALSKAVLAVAIVMAPYFPPRQNGASKVEQVV